MWNVETQSRRPLGRLTAPISGIFDKACCWRAGVGLNAQRRRLRRVRSECLSVMDGISRQVRGSVRRLTFSGSLIMGTMSESDENRESK